MPIPWEFFNQSSKLRISILIDPVQTLVYSIRLIPTNEGQMFSKKSRRLIFFLKLKSRQLFRNACMYSTQNSSFPSPSGIDVIFP